MKYLCDKKRHLICEPYSIENLHKMADELKIDRAWFHVSKRNLFHYDIPKNRIAEITSKCEIVSPFQIVKIIRSVYPAIKNKKEI